MKYINIDAEFMIEHGLTLEQAAFFSYLRESLSWSQDVIVDNISYKWVSRGKVILDIPYITSKPDTVYRWFNKLSELGLITYLKKDGKDLYRLNEVCKGWNSRLNSDVNPNKLGRQSENDSDGNPTYSNINSNSKKNDSKKEKAGGVFTLEESILFAKEKGYNAEFAKKFYNYYAQNNFRDRDNKLVKSWKGRMNSWITREDNNNFKLNEMGSSTEYDGVFYHEASGKYWREFKGQKYVCQKRGMFEYNDDGTKILFEV